MLAFLLFSTFTESISHQPEEHANYSHVCVLCKAEFTLSQTVDFFFCFNLNLETLEESVSIQCSSSRFMPNINIYFEC